MIGKILNFEDNFNADCLYDSFRFIKDHCNTNLLGLGHEVKFSPISKSWFEKIASLLSSRMYKYTSREASLNYKMSEAQNIVNSRILKNLIIETTFLNALLPYFRKEGNFNLTKYL